MLRKLENLITDKNCKNNSLTIKSFGKGSNHLWL